MKKPFKPGTDIPVEGIYKEGYASVVEGADSKAVESPREPESATAKDPGAFVKVEDHFSFCAACGKASTYGIIAGVEYTTGTIIRDSLRLCAKHLEELKVHLNSIAVKDIDGHPLTILGLD